MKDFVEQFLARKKAAMKHGEREKIAKAAGVSEVVVSRWGTFVGDSLKLPDIQECALAAKAMDVTPGWLAYGAPYARDQQAQDQIEKLSDLLEKLSPKDRSGALAMLETYVANHPRPAEDEAPVPAKKEKGRGKQELPKVTADYSDPKRPILAITNPNDRYQPVDLRHLLKTFHATDADDPKAHKIPRWLNAAAGEGCDLELCEDYIYFRELPDAKGVHSAVVRGDSMLLTLQPGDVIVMKEFDSGRWELPQIESKDEKAPLVEFKRQTKLEHNDICILSINDDAPTLKRIVFDTRRGKDWKLQIVADNPAAWGSAYQVSIGDKIIFHAKILGISDEARQQLRAKDKARPKWRQEL